MNKLYFPLFSCRYKEMLELLVSASLTVNSDRPGKLKPSRADADVWTLSDREGRPPAVCFSGPGGGSVQPTEHGKRLTALDTHPLPSTVITTTSLPIQLDY